MRPRMSPLLILICLPALAQRPFSCSVTAVPARLRAERLTELIGDILITCTGGTPTPANRSIPQETITIYLPGNVTSRIFSGGGSEALLLIDEPGRGSNVLQRLCASLTGCVVQGTGGSAEPFDGSDATRPDIFQGVVSGNSVSFVGIPVDAPGQNGIRTYRITNVRMNTAGLGANRAGPVPVTAAINVGATSFLALDNALPYVGIISGSLIFSVQSLAAAGCGLLSKSGPYATLDYTEEFASSFRTRTIAGADPRVSAVQNLPGVDYGSSGESGLIYPGIPGAGLADFGTRLKAVFTNIPPGLSIWVSTTNLGATAGSMAQLVPSESGPYQAVSPTDNLSAIDAVQIPVVNGTAAAVWEVTATNPALVEDFQFAVFFDGSGLTETAPTPAVNGSYAPTFAPAGEAGTAQLAGFPIPRSVDTSPADVLLSVSCRTLLLFPFVVSGQGFDTGLAISNTSIDPIGTTGPGGTCTLNAYGSSSPRPYITPQIAAGTTYTLLASTAFANFSGYVFALCRFPYSHGFAFISDAGARNLAMGYLALVIGTPAFRSDAPPGESAGH